MRKGAFSKHQVFTQSIIARIARRQGKRVHVRKYKWDYTHVLQRYSSVLASVQNAGGFRVQVRVLLRYPTEGHFTISALFATQVYIHTLTPLSALP